eukprot:TRINITY_DN15397_c0_g1_i1.p1 TRINITY_DN15397_c0_g1~~TRINITY_DN15397_c0_g1_i1.p1  ORF type:complete len:420 (-),score=36.97 TRINITY_DN15397_c0_g1_i1:215-1351(-)
MIQVITVLYRDYMPWRYQCITLQVVVEGLGRCMCLRVQQRSRAIWRQAANTFNEVTNQGVPAMSRGIVDGKLPPEGVWEVLATTLQRFFFVQVHDDSKDEEIDRRYKAQLEDMDSETLQLDAELVVNVLDSLCDSVMSICLHAPKKVRVRYVELLDEGVTRGFLYPEPEAISYRFSHACLRKMFVLCSRGSNSTLVSRVSESSVGSTSSTSQLAQGAISFMEVAQITFPMLIVRCDHLLREYASEDNEMGVHMDAHKKDLVLCIFQVLQELQLSWDLIDGVVESWPALQRLVVVTRERLYDDEDNQHHTKQRVHLLMLYDALCRCVTSGDAGVRETVMGLLLEAGAQLGLIVGSRGEGSNEDSSRIEGAEKSWFPLLS